MRGCAATAVRPTWSRAWLDSVNVGTKRRSDPMPWKKQGKGYTTKRGGNVAKPSMYEALRRKGASKTKAAKITNAKRGK